MELNERKLNILKAIVKDYIDTAEAIGSRTISKKHDFGVSAATIRNEMADLEELGYLIQPHTSAGRVPSVKGYRLYVDSLMNKGELTDEEKRLIENCMQNNIDNINGLIHETSKMLSKLTNYTTVAITKSIANNVIKYIQLVNLNENEILLIVVSAKGDVNKANIPVRENIEQAKLNLISDSLTKRLAGKSVADLDENFISYVKYQIGEFSMIVDTLIDVLNGEESDDDYSLTLNGATNIFNYPEFNDIIKAREFLNLVEEKDAVTDLIKQKGIQKDNLNILIGNENGKGLEKDCSVVTATYNVDNNTLGKISFIGPTRMDYARVCSIINYMSILLNKKK